MLNTELLTIWKSLWEKLVYCTDWCILNSPVFICKHCKHLQNYKRKKLTLGFLCFVVVLEVLKELFSCTFLTEKYVPKWTKAVSYGKTFYILNLFIAVSYKELSTEMCLLFCYTALKNSVIFVLIVQCLVEKCSFGARNCHYLIKAEHFGWSSNPSKCFWNKSYEIDFPTSKGDIIPLPVEFGNKNNSRKRIPEVFNSTVHVRCNLQSLRTRVLRNSSPWRYGEQVWEE